MCQTLSFLEALAVAHLDPMPLPVDLEPAAHVLSELGYDTFAVRRALGMVAMLGTAQCNEFIDPEDRDAVEEVLLDRPYAEWAAYDEYVYGLGPQA